MCLHELRARRYRGGGLLLSDCACNLEGKPGSLREEVNDSNNRQQNLRLLVTRSRGKIIPYTNIIHAFGGRQNRSGFIQTSLRTDCAGRVFNKAIPTVRDD